MKGGVVAGWGIIKERTLHHHAPVVQGRSGPDWLAIAVGLLSGRVVRYSHCVGRVLIHSSLYKDLWRAATTSSRYMAKLLKDANTNDTEKEES